MKVQMYTLTNGIVGFFINLHSKIYNHLFISFLRIVTGSSSAGNKKNEMKKQLIMAMMGVAAFSFYCCGNDEIEPNQNNGQEQGQELADKISASLRNTKWMGIVDCMDYVPVYKGNSYSFSHVDSLMSCHDTIYYDFGVDVDYPTFTKNVYLKEGDTWKRTISMWFDYKIKDGVLQLGFRSFPIYDSGIRDLQFIDLEHMMAEECGVKYELTRIK